MTKRCCLTCTRWIEYEGECITHGEIKNPEEHCCNDYALYDEEDDDIDVGPTTDVEEKIISALFQKLLDNTIMSPDHVLGVFSDKEGVLKGLSVYHHVYDCNSGDLEPPTILEDFIYWIGTVSERHEVFFDIHYIKRALKIMDVLFNAQIEDLEFMFYTGRPLIINYDGCGVMIAPLRTTKL